MIVVSTEGACWSGFAGSRWVRPWRSGRRDGGRGWRVRRWWRGCGTTHSDSGVVWWWWLTRPKRVACLP